ncbi:MAG TPA: glucosyl-3-phosphoglycerate synthase [Chitinivibrionales bacterium]|jgi:glucosyl-3-phosphoglycerate synthase|nr:glucosyl-3-phosphoglycerate synthase [Chitinivibrionales bacterium]
MIREFHHKDFLPLSSLAKKKQASRTTVSLVIPTFNEAATLGAILLKVKQDLQEDVPLLDEIIVMDSDSSDGTARIARDAGATVYNVRDVAPDHHVPPGKGSALWKAQFVATGDVIVCVDADIRNFQSHLVYGLVGPFLVDPDIIFAKAFYDRPLVLNDQTFENYGGRVTEILVRPLLCAFMPQLAAIYQPLSGEYAFRRKPVETIPFSSGYGVEIGMIFDINRAFGLSHFVQVDMGTRCHRNRAVGDLSRMALGIIQTLFRKLEKENVLSLRKPIGTTMITRGAHGMEQTTISEVELPSKESTSGLHRPASQKV